MNIFDMVIQLKDNFTRRDESLDATAPEKSNLQFDSADRIPVVDLDFVQCYLQDLRVRGLDKKLVVKRQKFTYNFFPQDSYSDYALFFHDRHGGNQIGVLFKPNVFQPQEFKVILFTALIFLTNVLSSI